MSLPDAAIRERILRVALDVFAKSGYQSATIRDICARASANIASVRYYFTDKQGLYREVLMLSIRESEQNYPDLAFSDVSLHPEDRLHLFIRTLLVRILDDASLGHHARLMAHELAEPTPALELIIDGILKPRFYALRAILSDLVREDWSSEDMDRLCHAVLGQCLVYRLARPMIGTLTPHLVASEDAILRTTEMIYQFSLSALSSMRDNRQDILARLSDPA